jgi:hypothetical protein
MTVRRMLRKAIGIIPDQFLDWLGETSTWRGIILVLTGMGIVVSHDSYEMVTAMGLLMVGAINIIRREEKRKPPRRVRKNGKPKYPRQ